MPMHQQGSTSVLEFAPGGIRPDLQEAHWKHPGARSVGWRWVHVWKGPDGYDASSGKPVKSIYLRKSYEVTVECDLLVPIYYKSCRLLRDLRSRILAIKAECKRNKGWIKCQACIQALQVVDIWPSLRSACSQFAGLRRDRYQRNVQVYWVEGQTKGRRLMFVCTRLAAPAIMETIWDRMMC